ncbi:chitinase A-like protein [Isoptericola sp. CG 20/1183]|uniref:Chitinase A-like protein n=1 Tax=Isoptericola halotolerans TaxID=300560 RepID=A0ABX5EFW0_9MICO|nr:MULTISPECIES: choice-of-anchor I family protein [Isoptericola]PRZ08287.1 chitinase A-like protein [Isoptericola halotolerans]PRZ09084.1 chitinase A-like protein [Isoptericola sp. CG 20/1183]
MPVRGIHPPAARAVAVALGLTLCGAALTLPARASVVDDPVGTSAEGAAIDLRALGSYETGLFDESGAEIVAYHGGSQRLFSVNAHAGEVTVLDVADPAAPTKLFALQTTGVAADDGSTVPAGAVANSVAVRADGLVAVAVESDPKTDAGWVVFFDAAADGSALGAVRVGALPDMVTFTPDGARAVVADEGEPDDDYTVDPEGDVAVVDVPDGVAAPSQDAVRIADFHAYEAEGALPAGVRVFAGIEGTDHPVSRNLEPEYVAVSADSTTAYAVLQEANAVAVVDLAGAEVTEIWPLGAKDFSIEGQGIDPSDEDGGIDVRTVPVQGLYMPDGLNAYTAGGETYLVTANEGDAREWGDYEEPVRIKDLGEDGVAPLCADSPVAGRTADEDLGRLDVSRASGLRADGECYEEVFAFGGRSFSIWTTDGEQVFDSGDDFERITAEAAPGNFNSDHGESSFESRSDAKGPEPENMAIGAVDGRTYAFVGLERVGGVMVYDVTDPAAAQFVQYVNNRDFSVSAEDAIDDGASPAEAVAAAGDLGPEGLAFIAGDDSPTGEPMLAVGNEVSGSTTLFAIDGPAATQVPARGVLTDDNAHDGVRGGAYTVSVDLWWGQSATQVRLLEDGEVVATRNLVDATPSAQHVEFDLTGRTDGRYTYTCELVNAAGTTDCRSHTVRVTDAAPAAPRLSHDNHDKDGAYTVSADLWWGTNATGWTLFEDGEQVATGELTDATPSAQHVEVPLTGREPGTHTYRMVFTNDLGETSSKELTVRVR